MMTAVGSQTTGRGKRPLSSLYLTDMSRGATVVAEDIFQAKPAGQDSKINKNFDDEPEPPRKYYEPHEIKIRLYLRECERLKVIPVGAYTRQPTKNMLKINHYNIGPDGAKALAAALLLDTSIFTLDIEGNSIGPVGLASIQLALADNLFITHLNIAENKIGSEGALMLGKLMLHNHTIEILNVARNEFRDSDCEIFAKILRENRVLRELVLAGNDFEELAGSVLGDALAMNENLERFDISWNHVRKRGAAEFAEGVKENISLKKLNVSFNGFGTEGALAMSHAVWTNRTLMELDMSKNRLHDIDMKIFCKHLHQNETLEVLKIGDNPMTPKGAMFVLKAVLHSEITVLEHLDFGNTSVDKGFLSLMKELQEKRDIKVTYGKVQNLYVDKEMEPKVEIAPPPASGLSEFIDGEEKDEGDNIEKANTYVVDKKDSGKEGEGEKAEEESVDFNEPELDKEVAAVTGKAEPVKQEAVYTERASVGTLTPDI